MDILEMYCYDCGSKINDYGYSLECDILTSIHLNGRYKILYGSQMGRCKYITHHHREIRQEIGCSSIEELKKVGAMTKMGDSTATCIEIWLGLFWVYKKYLELRKVEYCYCDDGKISHIEAIEVVKGSDFEKIWNQYWPFAITDDICPICGGELSYEEYLPDDDAEKELSVFMEESEDTLNTIDIIKVDKGKVDVIEYLRHLVLVENNIEFYRKRLHELLCNKYLSESICRHQKTMLDIEWRNEASKLEEDIRNIERNYPKIDEDIIDIDDVINKYKIVRPIDIVLPQEPVITKPIEPVLLKEGLFNKNKIRKQNAEILQAYNQALQSYHNIWKEYTEALNKYNENEKARKDYPEKCRYYIEKEEQEIKEIRAKRQELIVRKELITSRLDEIDISLENSPIYQYKSICIEEVKEVKDTLKKLIDCKLQLHSMNIIFPKYLDYISVVTILEYYESGRCNELTGANGAYNLYENELKQNVIIGKLDTIISQLEDVKQSQYLLYTSLKNIEKGINKLSTQFANIEKIATSMNYSINNIEKDIVSIKNNTAYTAYYTSKTAEYTKRNMELTDALGYLLAFK